MDSCEDSSLFCPSNVDEDFDEIFLELFIIKVKMRLLSIKVEYINLYNIIIYNKIIHRLSENHSSSSTDSFI